MEAVGAAARRLGELLRPLRGPGSGGAEEPQPARAAEGDDDDDDHRDVLRLLRLIEKIKQQLMECKVMIDRSEERTPDQIIEERLIESQVEELESEIEEAKTSFMNKTLALRRLQLGNTLKTKLVKNDSDSGLILTTLKHILTLSGAILKAQQETREMDERLLEVRKKRLALKQTGERQLVDIQTLKRKKKEELEGMEVSDLIKRIKENVQKEIQMTVVIQNVFQNIIIGTQVNWAEDPALKNIVLQLEKNLVS
ncbi:centromere protein H [Tachyglossus aculeatus]|uniref:centromere protein H n=1 Tax=Tachyglossus aculeatus TaxID=9261 RepID=UPI0018F43EEC|nr:centromere protein H [Tachyglossus aculeatus]